MSKVRRRQMKFDYSKVDSDFLEVAIKFFETDSYIKYISNDTIDFKINTFESIINETFKMYYTPSYEDKFEYNDLNIMLTSIVYKKVKSSHAFVGQSANGLSAFNKTVILEPIKDLKCNFGFKSEFLIPIESDTKISYCFQ